MRKIERPSYYSTPDHNELRKEGERLLDYQEFRVREEKCGLNPDIGISVVVAGWGEEIVAADLDDWIEEHIKSMGGNGIGQSFAGNTGFESSWCGKRLQYEEILPFQVGLAVRGISEALTRLGANVRDIRRLGFGSTTPVSMDVARLVAGSMGMSEDVRTDVAAAACNSCGILEDLHLREADQYDGLHAIVGVEMPMTMRSPAFGIDQGHPDWDLFGRGLMDRTVLSFFSDHMTTVVYDPSRFQVLASVSHGLKDEDGVLCAVNTVPYEGEVIDGYAGLVKRSEGGLVAYLPEPTENSQAGFMDALGTTRKMVTFLNEFLPMFGEEAGRLGYDFSEVNYVLLHHPSELLHGKQVKMLRKYGMPEYVEEDGMVRVLAPWSSDHCNAPACTHGMEVGRVAPHLRPGQQIVKVFFAGGINGQARLEKIV